jgi:PAS domain S-box-containing protein
MRNTMTQTKQYLEMLVAREADPLANDLFVRRLRSIELRIESILRSEGLLSVTVYGADGAHLAHLDRAGGRLPREENRVIAHATEARTETVEREGMPVLVYQSPVFALGKPTGFIRLEYSLAEMERERRVFIFAAAALLTVTCFLMLVVLNSVLSVTVSRPILNLKAAIQRVDEEGPGESISHASGDEIGDLIAAFNRMSTQLREMVTAIQVEILERKQAEDALRSSEEQLKAMFEMASVGIGQADPKTGQFLRVNRKLCEITGYSSGELLAMRIQDITHPQDRDRDWTSFQDVVNNKRRDYRLEKRYLRKDGVIVWVNVNMTVLRDTAGQPMRTMATIEDITERKRGEQALRESEVKFRTLFENAGDAIFVMQDERFDACNARSLQMFGCSTREQILGSTPIHFSPPIQPNGRDSRELAMERITAALAGQPQFFEWVHTKLDGTPFPVEVSLNRLELADSRLLQAVVRDITERKRAEQERERLMLAIEQVSETIMITTPKRNIEYVNPAFERTTGHPRDEAVGKSFETYCTRRSKDQILPQVRRELERNGRWQGKLAYRKLDGAECEAEATVSAVRDKAGQVVNYISILKDVTREAKLEAQLAQALELTGAMIWEYRLPEQEHWLDKTACEMLGIEPRDLPISRQTWVERFLHPDDLGKSEALISSVIRHEISLAEFRNRLRNQKTGEWRLVHGRGAVLEKDADGRPLRVVGTAMDFTDRQHLEEQLAQSQKLEAIGTLAGGIAHDFNNILSAIIGYSELLTLFHIPKDSPARPELDQVLKAANRAKDLVQQILTLSRKTKQEKKPVLLGPIIKETLQFLRATLPANIEIRRSIQSETSKILADSTQMHQILMNLCTNAAHAMGNSGGVLGINLEDIDLDAQSAERFLDLAPGPYLRLTVTDTGKGMEPVVLQRIFEPYFTTKEQGEGTGLGLAVIHGIIKDHGGVITVDSEPGKGSTFQVLLPSLVNEPVASAMDVSESLPKGSERVLFIDDEEAIANMARGVLEQLGYAVVAETDSSKALEVFRSSPGSFDVVVTDLTMPRMTGLELADKLKAVRPEVLIILYSGSIAPSLWEEAQRVGIKGFLSKPIGARDLAEAVRRVLDEDR